MIRDFSILQLQGDAFRGEDRGTAPQEPGFLSYATSKTRLEREFHPQAVRELKAQSALEIAVAGPTLAAHAIRTGLVDEYHLLVVPTMLGRGTQVLPSNVRIGLDLLHERRFANGMVYLRYHAKA